MRYVIGIDEAGYGPNLGPLVQAAVAVRVPNKVQCLWTALSRGVRRAADDDDGRVLIDDSKLVHSGPHGLHRLERTIIGLLGRSQALGRFLDTCACPPSGDDLRTEPWYQCDEPLPVTAPADEIRSAFDARFNDAAREQGLSFRMVRALVTPAPRFNALLDRWETKGAVLAHGLIALLADIERSLPERVACEFIVDKHGGRNFYAPMIQTAFPDGWVVPIVETNDRSDYRIEKLSRPITLTFQPRADSASLPVALASMTAKYLREVFMRQFNRYWQQHVPDLEPTAGYPTDAGRFYALIQRAMRQLGMNEDQVWRKR